jgi:lysozyme
MLWGLARPIGWLLALGLLVMGGWIGATRWHPSIARYPLQGIDLPIDPGPVDWGTVRALGADFAYIVATDGARRRALDFEANWAALPDAGLRRGAVHLFSLCQPAVDQANAFNVVVPRVDDALPAAVDISFRPDCADRPEPAKLIADLRGFLSTVEAHTGKPVLVRVSRSVDRAFGITAALPRPVWAVGNILTPSYPARTWQMWRATDMRHIDGTEGPVGWNVVAP